MTVKARISIPKIAALSQRAVVKVEVLAALAASWSTSLGTKVVNDVVMMTAASTKGTMVVGGGKRGRKWSRAMDLARGFGLN